jgi:hypothetical protein
VITTPKIYQPKLAHVVKRLAFLVALQDIVTAAMAPDRQFTEIGAACLPESQLLLSAVRMNAKRQY